MYQEVKIKILEICKEEKILIKEAMLNSLKIEFYERDIIFINNKTYKVKSLRKSHEFYNEGLLTCIKIDVEELKN